MSISSNQRRKSVQFFHRFVDHPAQVDETYWQHAGFALGFSGALACAALAAFVHALIPPLFETTAGRVVRDLHTRLSDRH